MEAHDSGLSEAEKKTAKGPLLPLVMGDILIRFLPRSIECVSSKMKIGCACRVLWVHYLHSRDCLACIIRSSIAHGLRSGDKDMCVQSEGAVFIYTFSRSLHPWVSRVVGGVIDLAELLHNTLLCRLVPFVFCKYGKLALVELSTLLWMTGNIATDDQYAAVALFVESRGNAMHKFEFVVGPFAGEQVNGPGNEPLISHETQVGKLVDEYNEPQRNRSRA